jgi:hypothetical protein
VTHSSPGGLLNALIYTLNMRGTKTYAGHARDALLQAIETYVADCKMQTAVELARRDATSACSMCGESHP